MMSSNDATNAPDIYGQIHPEETDDLIKEKLKEFHSELLKIPLEKRKTAKLAEEKCPEVVTDDFKLWFLRCEVFHADLAAARYVAYWDERVELFGNDRAFKPLLLSNMTDVEIDAGMLGFAAAIHATKDSDRSIFFMQPGKLDKKKYQDRANVVRIIWYIIHVILQESIATQKKGIIFISYPRNAKMFQFDSKLSQMMLESMKGRLPVRLSAIHICHPPSIFKVIWPIVSLFMSTQMKKRVRVHIGSDERVLQVLKDDFQMDLSDIPVELGGSRQCDPNVWFDERRRIEK